MIVHDLSLDQIRNETTPLLAHWEDQVVPSRVEPVANNLYAAGYAWMFAYEKRLKYRIEDALGRRLGAFETRLFGMDGVFSEGLSNAFVHGHRRDPELSITVTCWVADRVLAFRIRDQGPGFAVDAVLTAARGGAGYYRFAGNGLRALASAEDVTAGYADSGRELLLRVRQPHEATGNPSTRRAR